MNRMAYCKRSINYKINSIPPWSSLRISSLLVLLLASISWSVSGEHALSEVWSEADGLQLKYSTDHDDLLSTKSSELSLASQQKSDQAQASPDSSSSGQESEESSDGLARQQDDTAEGNAGSQAGLQSLENKDTPDETEQGTDSSSRRSEKVPAAGHPATSTTSSKFSEPAARFRSAARASEANGRASLTSRLRSTSDAIRFSSALDMANADAGSDETDRTSPEGADDQLKTPGRAAKTYQTSSEETSNVINDDQDVEQAEPGEDGNELSNSALRTARLDAARNRPAMFEFERSVASVSGESGGHVKQEQNNADIPEPVMLSEPQDSEKGQPAGDEEPRLPVSADAKVTADESEDAASDEDAAASATKQLKQAERQQRPALAYFRQASPAQTRAESPDSVRDDFISPGHFPGSMAHLTQAASELKQVDLAAGKPQLEQQAASLTVPTAVSAPPRGQVTPEPASQPESRQIVAPVLIPTTTMAPMPATSSTPEPSVNASDTAAPTLKRFKFRKYR